MEFTHINAILTHLKYDFCVTTFGYYQIVGFGGYPYTDFTSDTVIDHKYQISDLFVTLKVSYVCKTILLPTEKPVIGLWVNLD